MEYKELEQIFAAHEATQPKYHLDGYITFSDLGSHEDPNYHIGTVLCSYA